MDIISARKLEKKFGKFTAVDKISFSVKTGELFGLLGPNGAGKTTTINMLSTLLKPTSGNCRLAGFDVSKSKAKVRENIGIVFQEPALDGRLTGKENLEFHAMIYGLGKKEREEKIIEVLGLVELSDKSDVLVDNYSGGMKRRLEIARGLIHNPKVLFLDEPTLGLDAQTRRHIWDYIKRLNEEENVSMILTTHYMEEADELCHRVAIIDKGKIVAMGRPSKLKDALGGDLVSIDVDGDTEKLIKKLRAMRCVGKIKCIKKASSSGNTINLALRQGEKKIPVIIDMAKKSGLRVESVSLRKPSLEDVFLHFTGRSIRDGESNENRNHMMRMGH